MTRIGVIGSGVAGLTAAYLLQRKYDVTLFEAADRLGGHAHTHEVTSAHGGTIAIDSGFIVHNDRTYPNLRRLLAELEVPSIETEMSMSINCAGCGLAYAGAKGLRGLFGKAGNLARPRYLRMLAEVKRFHAHARQVLAAHGDDAQGQTLGAFLATGGYTQYFCDHFILPLVSTVWSAEHGDTLRYPARYLFEFLRNHGMLAVSGSPKWRTIPGGSASYVERAAKHLTSVNLCTPVRSVQRSAAGVLIRDEADAMHEFGGVVVATHADQALRLLERPSPAEKQALGAFRYSRNEAWLHTDPALLPARRGLRAGWNYVAQHCAAGRGAARVSYDMNRLMRLDEPRRYVVSLNPASAPQPHTVLAQMVYEHPVYTPESRAAQGRLAGLNDNRTAYAGAYHGWGFHEDGCAAGVRAASHFGVHW